MRFTHHEHAVLGQPGEWCVGRTLRLLVPGMPAEVLINTGQRTLFQYLVDPIKNTFARSLIED